MKIFLVRVVSDFYPIMGGSVKDVVELSEVMDPYLEKQIIIAPQYKMGYSKEFDNSFQIPIKRVKSTFLDLSQYKKISGNSLINHLFYYAMNVSKMIKDLTKNGYRIDIVQAHFNELGLYLSIWFKIFKIPIPISIMNHGSSVPLGTKYNSIVKFSYKMMMLLFTWFKPDYYIQLDDGTIDNHFLNELTKLEIPHSTVFHAFDTQFYNPQPAKKSNINFIVLSNHRFVPFKRVDLAIIAFKMFLEISNYPKNIKLRLIGSGILQKQLEDLVEECQLSSYVDFAGEKNFEDYHDELASADIVIGTSLISNVNRSIQEAMGYEKPVIVFDSISYNDLFVDMDNSILIPIGDLEKFAKSIKLLYNDSMLRDKLSKNARKAIIDRRSWKKRIDEELSIYNQIIQNFRNNNT